MINDREKLRRLVALYRQLPAFNPNGSMAPFQRAIQTMLKLEIMERGHLLNDQTATRFMDTEGDAMVEALTMTDTVTVRGKDRRRSDDDSGVTVTAGTAGSDSHMTP